MADGHVDDITLLRALGLTAAQAAVLQALCATADTTACAIAAETGLRRSQVSEALQVLEQHGLVERFRGQRPHPVSLVATPDAALQVLLRRLEDEREHADSRARAAAELLRERSATLARVPRAWRRRRLPGDGPGADHDLLVAARSYDEVARLGSTTVRYGVPLHPSRARRRLLVLGEPPLERRRWWTEKGVEVRTTDEALPAVIVVDGVRGRVEVGTTGPRPTRWTSDPAQVRALQQLFELWWQAAERGSE
jgi:DNA-binding MarR family transcriptional regulator